MAKNFHKLKNSTGKVPAKVFWVIFVILVIVSFVVLIPRFLSTKQPARITNCMSNLVCLSRMMGVLYEERRENGKIEAHYKKDDEYWWVEALANTGWVEKGKTRLLYCLEDTEQKKYPSSYIANPKLNVIDIEKVPHRDRKILLMEREPFHKEYFKLYGEPFYHCIMADFQFKRIPKSKINLYKDW